MSLLSSNNQLLSNLQCCTCFSGLLHRILPAAPISVFGKALFLFVLFSSNLFIPTTVNAKDNSILILLSGNDDVYLDVATAITNSTIKLCRNRNLECQDTNFEISQVSSLDIPPSGEYRLIVTLGIKAANYAKTNLAEKLVFSALIPQYSNDLSVALSNDSNQYYLYLDQPHHRSLLLINALSDRFKNVGVMINKNNEVTARQLADSASKLGLTLHLEKISKSNQIGASLNRLLRNIDILLAVPDTTIHNKSTVSNILISTYRKRIPLIGFSSGYVKAGALAAVYSSPEDIAYHVRDNIVNTYSGEGIEEKEQTANYFTLLFNSDVARSLDFPLKSESELTSKMIRSSKDEDHD
ncbi:MAG: ABC transporter substrate binding protein [Candidatus Thiodiazotropha sp.]